MSRLFSPRGDVLLDDEDDEAPPTPSTRYVELLFPERRADVWYAEGRCRNCRKFWSVVKPGEEPPGTLSDGRRWGRCLGCQRALLIDARRIDVSPEPSRCRGCGERVYRERGRRDGATFAVDGHHYVRHLCEDEREALRRASAPGDPYII